MYSPPPAPDEELAREYRSLKRVLKKLMTMILIGCLILYKLFAITYVKNHFGLNSNIVDFTAYLSLLAIAFLIPLYIITGVVRGYGLFLVCACASLVNDSAEFFLFLGIFGVGPCVIFEFIHFVLLLLVLTLIERLFQEVKEEERRSEEIPLSNFGYIGQFNGSDGLTNTEREARQVSIWRRFQSVMRSASF